MTRGDDMHAGGRRRARRTIVAGILLLALVSVFVVRLVDIQVVHAAEVNAQADNVRSQTRTVYGARGSIVDANGVVLADSVMRYDVAVSPKQAKGALSIATYAKDAERLAAVLGVPANSITGTIESSLQANPDSDYALVAKQVETSVYSQIKALKITWVYTQDHPGRRYPNGAVAGNLVGFVGSDGKPLAGLEDTQDTCLKGADGQVTSLHSLKDWVDIPGTTVVKKPAKQGGTLKLTIDSDLQWDVQRIAAAQVQATEAKWGVVTVMDAKTGKLLAVVDVPTVDPNDPAATDAANRGSRVFTAPFEPGSTFKALTAASAIDAGKADPGTQVVAPYRITPGSANINDSEFHGAENLTLTGVLIESSNTGMSQIGAKLTDEQRYAYMQKFGLGKPTEVGFLGEESGDLHGGPTVWANDDQTKYATMFGQGLTTTAVQIASVYQTIANGGVRMPVSLVAGCTRSDGTVTEQPSTKGTRVISPQAAQETSQILEQVYLHGWLRNTWKIDGYRVAAKTGTAQVAGPDGHYLPGYLVSVSGFAPADDPRYVVSVSLMDPVKMNSSAASAPVFRDVMSQVLKKYRTVPSGAPAPELPATW